MKKIFLGIFFFMSINLFSVDFCNINLVGPRFFNGTISKPLLTSAAMNMGFFVPYPTKFVEAYVCGESELQVFIAMSLYLNNGQYYSANSFN